MTRWVFGLPSVRRGRDLHTGEEVWNVVDQETRQTLGDLMTLDGLGHRYGVTSDLLPRDLGCSRNAGRLESVFPSAERPLQLRNHLPPTAQWRARLIHSCLTHSLIALL